MTAVLSGVAPEVAPPSPDAGPEDPSPSAAAGVPGAGWLAVGAIASKGAQTIVLLAFAAALEPSAFGIVSLGAVLLNATAVVADLGTSTALVHFRGDAERAARTALTIALTTSLGLVLAVWIAAPQLAGFLQIGDLGTTVFRGIVLCLPLAAVAGVSAELLRRALLFRRRVLPDIIGNSIGAAATIAALAWGQGALSLVYGQVTQAVVVLLLFWLLRAPVRPGWSGADASGLVTYGAGIAGSGLLTLAMLNVDYVMVANRLGAEQVGIYSMAFRVAYMPYLLIAMVIGGAVFAHLCRLRGAAVWGATVDAAVVLHAWVVPAYVGVLVLAPQLELLGAEWAPAVPALRWLAGYGLALSALELLLVALKSVGRTTDLLGLGALHFGVLLLLLLLYVDQGVTAVAMAQCVAGVVTVLIARAIVAARVPGVEWRPLARRLLPVAAGAVAMAGVAIAVDRVLPWGPVSPARLLVVGVLGLAAYAVTLVLLHRGRHRRLVLSMLGLAATGAAVGAASVLAPHAVLVALLALTVVGAAVVRVEWAAMAYVALEPWGDVLRDVHPSAIKVAGALLLASWLVRLVRDPRPAGLRHPAVVAVAALVTVVLASFAVHGADPSVGLDRATTYAAYAVVVVVLVDTVRTGRPTGAVGRRLVTVFAGSCTLAGAVALAGFLRNGGRAGGPLEDPNDLAFFLVAALPLLMLGSRRTAHLRAACAVVLVVAILATFSRGALLGLAVALLVAVLLGAVRLSTAVGVGLVASVAVGALWATHADVVARSIEEKSSIAAANVASRATTATMAARMTADSPLLGQGPGGFAEAAPRFVPPGAADVDETVAHQMYLDVGAELGLLGLAAFLAALAYAVRGALRARRSKDRAPLAHAVLISFAGVLAAACFLSEQVYLPVWLLVALGAALDPCPTPRTRWW